MAYEKILVPTDGSEGAEKASEHAVEIAKKFDAEVHVLYVVDVRVNSAKDAISNLTGALRETGEEVTERLSEQVESHGLETARDVIEGIPHQEINSYVERNDVDLVVMGTHGRTGLDRLMLGSTAEKVVRTSDVPVMTVSSRND